MLFILIAGARALAAEAPEDRLRALIQRLPPVDQEFLASAKFAGQYPLSRLVSFSNRAGRLAATFHLPTDLVKQFADPAPVLVLLEGSPHVWSLHRRKSGTLDEGLSLVSLTCYAPDETWPFNRYSLSSDGQSLMVAGAQMFGHPAGQQTLSMSQGERALRLAWRLEADRWAPKRVDVADMVQLPTRAPALMDRYLLPVLRRLGPAMSASDVYRVFEQIPADPRAVERVQPLLSALDSDDALARDAAVASLKSMGRPAVLACLRSDLSLLSPEQQNRLAAYYASEGWLHVPDVEAARRDGEFLTACLEDEDAAVRTAAANMLAGLRTVQQLRR